MFSINSMSIVSYKPLEEFLKTLTVNKLKKKSKSLKLKGYSKLKKEYLIEQIIYYFACIQIQRFLRNKKSFDKLCVISREPFRYPCWGKIAPKTRQFFYYNLEPLVQYILATGHHAIDPILRTSYTLTDIENIDKIYKSTELPKRIGIKSLLIMYQKKGYYKKKKDLDEQVDIYIDQLKTSTNIIKDRICFYNDECFNVDLNVATQFIANKIKYMRPNFNGLYRISKYWSKRSFCMMVDIIETIKKENQIKRNCIQLIKDEKKNFTY